MLFDMDARVCSLLVVTLVAGCGGSSRGASPQTGDPCQGKSGRGFSLSLARNYGGAMTAQKAAEAQSGRSGWRVLREDGSGVTLARQRATRHVLQGSDKSWQVDSGTDC